MFIIKLLAFIFLPFLLPMLYYFLYFYFHDNKRFIKGEYKYIGYGNFFKRLFVEFPRQFVLDRYNNNPDEFKEYGVHIICGEQGSGKTMTLTYLLQRFQKMYPLLKVRTNYDYALQDGAIESWEDIIKINNGIYGQIDVLDEIQNWFNSMQSKDFPPEMLTEITQQRKQRKIVFGTSQVFCRMAKPLREQCMFLYEPLTVFGCLTIVRVYKPVVSADGLTDDKKLRKIFFFVQSAELRGIFDTYRKIENLSIFGFQPREKQLRNNTVLPQMA